MKKKRIVIQYDGEKVVYRYSVTKAGNVRVIHMEKPDEYGDMEECEVVIAKTDWYYLAFPDMGTASFGFSTLGDYGLVADLVHDAGYYNPDTEAITLAIMDISKTGF